VGRSCGCMAFNPLHSDHVGAITEILNMDPMPISIGKVYYSFLNKEFLGQEQVSRRDSDLECYDRITEAIAKLPEAEKCGTLTKGQKISVAGAEITVMNEPFACTENSFNNSSVAYRVEMGGKRILFLGDMGWQAGEDFLANHTQEELKSDVLQMAHHGQRGVEEELYQRFHRRSAYGRRRTGSGIMCRMASRALVRIRRRLSVDGW
ncbi:MAG: hypothetical protein ACLSH1_08045, partial [Clostridia bacterium]